MTATAKLLGRLKFLHSETQSSLYRNDRVRMVRDHRGNFVESYGVATQPHELQIADARLLTAGKRMTLEENGFELVSAPVAGYDFMDHEQVTGDYYRDCEALVAQQTGGQVWAFDHNIRSATGQADKRQEKRRSGRSSTRTHCSRRLYPALGTRAAAAIDPNTQCE
jgi:hypothetical protein